MCLENKNSSMLFQQLKKLNFYPFVFFYAVQFQEKKLEEQKTNRQRVIIVS